MTDAEKATHVEKARLKEEKRLRDWNETLAQVIALRGQRCQVLGDGFCWLYAYLVHFGALENPLCPSKRDKALCTLILGEMKKFVEAGGMCSWGTEPRKKQMAAAHTPYCGRGAGTYSGLTLGYPVLCAMLEVPIVSTTTPWMSYNIMTQQTGSHKAKHLMAYDVVEPLAFNEVKVDGRAERVRCVFGSRAVDTSRV